MPTNGWRGRPSHRSSYVKELEGETDQTVQREHIHERLLPDLAGNIKS